MPVPMPRFKRRYLYPLLTLYILAGAAITPFHADEADHLFKARDYVTYFVIGDPGRLRVDPPVQIDSEAHIRLLTGTTSAYLTGLILWHSGYTDLDTWNPPWYYPDSLAENLVAGRRPPPDVLWRGRLASTFLTMIAALLLFRIAARLAGERAGLITLIIFVLHPVILLNGRRIMQEGALLCFSLQVVNLALSPRNKFLSDDLRSRLKSTVALGIAIGFALASKPTTLITVAAVLIGLLFADGRAFARPYRFSVFNFFAFRILHFTFFLLPFSFFIYLLLTPAIWSAPFSRIQLAADLRAEVLQGQTAASEHAYDQPVDRLTALITQPFPARVEYYESPQFVGLAPEIRRYQKSPWQGMMLPALPGMILALIGGLRLWRQPSSASRLILIWMAITAVGMVLAVPLGWQRYYLPWTLIMILLAGLGMDVLLSKLWMRGGQTRHLD